MLETPLVVIDTSELRRLHFDWSHPTLRALRDHVDQRTLRILIPSVFFREIRSQIATLAREAHAKLQDMRRISPHLAAVNGLNEMLRKLPTADEMVTTAIAAADRFLRDELDGALLVADYLNGEQLLDQYFEGKPPFAAEKGKRHEFPDAIALLTLIPWLEKNKSKAYLVSRDGRLREACSQLACLLPVDNLETVLGYATGENGLKAVLETYLREHWNASLEARIQEEFESLGFVLEPWDGEVEDVEPTEALEPSELEILVRKDRELTARGTSEVSFNALAEYADYGSSVYDTETGNYLYLRQVRQNIQRKATVEVIFRARLNEDFSAVESVTINLPSTQTVIINLGEDALANEEEHCAVR
ncbi:MAG: DUF4935 domain-containing protein [Rhodanobacteraceae bacterium]|jgi:hypothetical protein|nr:DUF4935 domain-containing protein [Rhodanobacteraceae bacterium]